LKEQVSWRGPVGTVPWSLLPKRVAQHCQAATCFRNTILVFTPPHCAHSNLCIERSRRVGCRSMRASFIGLRHLGQVSFINRSKDMARPLVGSVAGVLARNRRTICKNPRNAALALRRSQLLFPYAKHWIWGRPSELRRQTRNPDNWLATRGLPYSVRIMRTDFILGERARPSVGASTYRHIRQLLE
jgi:hypothetical protein